MWFCFLYIKFVGKNHDKTILKFHIFQRSQKYQRFIILEISKMLDQKSNNWGDKQMPGLCNTWKGRTDLCLVLLPVLLSALAFIPAEAGKSEQLLGIGSMSLKIWGLRHMKVSTRPLRETWRGMFQDHQQNRSRLRIRLEKN